MFNFKEGPKRPMLKVQYFKHPNIAGHIYKRFLAAYGRFPWNDEVLIYFARLFYAEIFCACTPIIPVYHLDIMGLVKVEHMIENGHIEMHHC